MSPETFTNLLLAVTLFLASGGQTAWAGSNINLNNKGRNNVSVRFITINPNSTILNRPEVVHVNANSSINYNLKDPCIYEIYVNGILRMSPQEKTGLGLGCFNLTGFNYALIIEPDGSVKLQ
jgi:hypothetical protein